MAYNSNNNHNVTKTQIYPLLHHIMFKLFEKKAYI